MPELTMHSTQNDANESSSLINDNVVEGDLATRVAKLEANAEKQDRIIEETLRLYHDSQQKIAELEYRSARQNIPANHSGEAAHPPSNSPRLWRGG